MKVIINGIPIKIKPSWFASVSNTKEKDEYKVELIIKSDKVLSDYDKEKIAEIIVETLK
jgi:hypothetical protein